MQSSNEAKISMISYDEVSEIVFERQDPSLNLIQKMSYSGFGTNFEKPMKDAYDVATAT